MVMSKKYDNLVYIGRFQPFHLGHYETIQTGLQLADNIIVVIGSHRVARDPKNPFTAKERQEMIERNFGPNELSRIIFVYVEDRIHQEQEWVKMVQRKVSSAIRLNSSDGGTGIIAHDKDESTYYVKNFPNWKHVPIEGFTNDVQGKTISATKIRELMFEEHMSYIKSNVPPQAYEWLKEFHYTEAFKILQHEYNEGVAYENIFQQFPYTVNFVTTDAVVVQSGHILLVQRGNTPGKGLWALPGGHLDGQETALDGVVRELREETCIKVPEKVLRGSIRHTKVFDHPERSLRARLKTKKGRTITHAFCFELDNNNKLPRVKGADDAAYARWFPLASIDDMREKLFEDHADIINYFVSRL